MKAAVNNHLEITAVCDLLPERMETLLEAHGLQTNGQIRRFTDYKTLVHDLSLIHI